MRTEDRIFSYFNGTPDDEDRIHIRILPYKNFLFTLCIGDNKVLFYVLVINSDKMSRVMM